jgi:hypothetical protein
MLDDGLGDWRIQAASRLAEDVPAAFPGGPSHKAGTPVHQATSTRVHQKQPIGFVTPSATALALSVAIKASIQAKELREELTFDEVLTPDGKGRSVGFNNIAPLYDYFEYCMIAVTFSFQALETFSNHTIASRLKGTYNLRRRDGTRTVTHMELEREASTEEKLATVLPDILGKKSPKGGTVWQNFVKVKRARDSTVHLKSLDQYPNQHSKVGTEQDTLFYQFLNNDPTDFPKASIRVIKYFVSLEQIPRWLLDPLEFLGEEKQ